MYEYVELYFKETKELIDMLNKDNIVSAISALKHIKGRLFIIGLGGSAANASHAVNDFRKIAGIESYTPVDNISELTAYANDESFESIFVESLINSNMCNNDILLVLSVGGGTDKVSKSIVKAMQYAKSKNIKIISIVSRDGGYAKQLSDICIHIPIISEERITPHAESFQSSIIHLIVNALKKV